MKDRSQKGGKEDDVHAPDADQTKPRPPVSQKNASGRSDVLACRDSHVPACVLQIQLECSSKYMPLLRMKEASHRPEL